MNVLAIDTGGTHVKILTTGEKIHREFTSGPMLTATRLLCPFSVYSPAACSHVPAKGSSRSNFSRSVLTVFWAPDAFKLARIMVENCPDVLTSVPSSSVFRPSSVVITLFDRVYDALSART